MPTKNRMIIYIIISLLIVSVSASAVVYALMMSSNSASSTEKLDDNYIPGVVTVTFKPEYRNDKQLLEDIAKFAGGKIQYYDYDGFEEEGTYKILVNEGSEKSTVAYLKTRTEVEYAMLTLGGSIN